MSDQRYLILDYETRSLADLKRCGVHEYAAHPSTQILCAAWRVGSLKTLRDSHVKRYRLGHKDAELQREELIEQLKDRRLIAVAHNVMFERLITLFCLGIDIPIDRWICTAATAAHWAFPRSLEGVCDALDLRVKKDPRGKQLVRRYCFPRKLSKKNPAPFHEDRAGLIDLTKYCMTDVRAETEVFLTLKALPKRERAIWELDQKMNLGGLKIDRKAVELISKMIKLETKRLTAKLQVVTEGKVEKATQRARMLKWVNDEGLWLPNLQKKTVEDALKAKMGKPHVRRALRLRQSLSLTSNAKYTSFEAATRHDGRLRDTLMYCGAGTKRWSGKGVQVHNFPQGHLDDPEDAVDTILSGDLEWVRALHGDPLKVFSSTLRSMIKADPGLSLYAGDFRAIEVRILWWLAGHQKGLDIYAHKRDAYREMAAIVFGVKLSKVTDAQREVGKRIILGCGFGMGWLTFMATCEKAGIPIEKELSQKSVTTYRKVHSPVPRLWSNLEKAAIAAVKNPKKTYSINKTTWRMHGKYLHCRGPSGGELTFYGPEIRYQKTPWGEKRPVLYHWDIHPKTRQWVFVGTYGGKLAENLVQFTARELMADAMLRLEGSGFSLAFTVHDEVIAQNKKKRLKKFHQIMTKTPAWGAGLPVEVKSFEAQRYRKD